MKEETTHNTTPLIIYRDTEGMITGSRKLLLSRRKSSEIDHISSPPKRGASNIIRSFLVWLRHVSASIIILGILLFIIVNFYVFASLVNFNRFFYIFLMLSLLTDGLFIMIHLFRKESKHKNVSFDPQKLTMLIACYNGEDVIGQTIENCLRHVPKKHIVVVSDASTDSTVDIARSYGVKVLQNKKNLSKALSVNAGMELVKTPYVLLLDDDVLIGDAVIPTSLLDDGYSAVAFDVMPIAKDTLVNNIQRFEYRNSMHIGKSLRGSVGAVGNVSGAIGLYRTDDLRKQGNYHSGQFAGEDEQRTLLSHMYSSGKGVTYSEETVLTLAPSTFYSLYRQRAYSWSLAVPELFTMYWRIILSPKYHYLLKAEKAYYLYIYLTDPLRLLFLWALILRPHQLFMTYGFYLVLNTLVWLKTKRKDHFAMVLIYPLYTLWLGLCRFIGNFYWLKVKFQYLRKKLYRSIRGRKLIAEYSLVLTVFVTAWFISSVHFFGDVRLFNKIRGSKLENTQKTFSYESSTGSPVDSVSKLESIKIVGTPPQQGSYVTVPLEKGDTDRAIAYKAIDSILLSHPEIKLSYKERSRVIEQIAHQLTDQGIFITSNNALINSVMIQQQIQELATNENV